MANTAISQINRIVPDLIKKIGSQINQISQRRIKQAITQVSKEIERVAPRIKGAIKDFYKTAFRLLGALGRKKYTQV